MQIRKLGKWACVIGTGLILITACAHHAVEQKLDQKLARETEIESQNTFQKKTNRLLENVPNITPEQRSKLISLRDKTRSESDQIWKERLKLRYVLVQDLLSPDYDKDEVNLIKDRMKKLDDERLQLTLNAIRDANTILGRKTAENREISDHFYEIYGGPRM